MEYAKKKIGLIVNPLAGIGGKVGLKGSDGVYIVRKAFDLGAKIVSPDRAIETLELLTNEKDYFDLVTYAEEMGEHEAKNCSYKPVVLGEIESGNTSAEDTRQAALAMKAYGVDLIVFVGGDGTARDIYDAVGLDVPVLGIPAGVKIHSSVYAVNPRRAAELIRAFLRNKVTTQKKEVMDIDENLFRQGRVSAQLFGYLEVPFEQNLMQGAKAASNTSFENLSKIAEAVLARMDEENTYYILGPGTTVQAVGNILGIDKSLLGVDVVYNGEQVGKDMNESDLLELISGKKAKIIVTIIGGQGYVFGRGNQQLSPKVIREVGKENIVIISGKNKLISLDGPLLVDTGDISCDKHLSGYTRVITGLNEETIWKIES